MAMHNRGAKEFWKLTEFKSMNAGAVCASREIFTLKAPYQFGKLAEFTEIHDYLFIQLQFHCHFTSL